MYTLQISKCTPKITDSGPAGRAPNASVMKIFLRGLIMVAAAVLPAFYFIKENPFDITSFLTLVSTRNLEYSQVKILGLKDNIISRVHLWELVTNNVDTQRRKTGIVQDSIYPFSLVNSVRMMTL